MDEHYSLQARAGTPEQVPYPSLPVEIVREIIELAARGQKKRDALQLLLVSHAVRQWIIPIVYDHIEFVESELSISSSSKDETRHWILTPRRLHALMVTMEDGGVGAHVRRLDMLFELNCLDYRRADEELSRIFTALPRLQSLTLCDAISYPEGTDGWATPWFVRLLGYGKARIGMTPSHPLFRKMTHLSVGWRKIELLMVLVYPALTHLAFHCDVDFSRNDDADFLLSDLRMIFSLRRDIQSVVVVLQSEGNPVDNFDQEPWSSLSEIQDERLLLWPVRTREEVAETFRLDGPELWLRAEEEWGKWSTIWRRLQEM